METSIKPIGYQCQEDCTLDGTNFEYGEIITIPIDEPNPDWKGTVFFDKYHLIFKPVYTGPVPELLEMLIKLTADEHIEQELYDRWIKDAKELIKKATE